MSQSELNIIKRHLAKSLYAQEWADWADRSGAMGAGMQILDQLGTIEEKYMIQATAVAAVHAAKNNMSFMDIVAKLAVADGADATNPQWLEELGHDLGMMATGSGVGWFDDHEKCPGIDLHTTCIYSDGIGWDESDDWYGRDVDRYAVELADGSVWRYAFDPSCRFEMVQETIHEQFESMQMELPISINRTV